MPKKKASNKLQKPKEPDYEVIHLEIPIARNNARMTDRPTQLNVDIGYRRNQNLRKAANVLRDGLRESRQPLDNHREEYTYSASIRWLLRQIADALDSENEGHEPEIEVHELPKDQFQEVTNG